jgi:hypothetical protein
MTIEFTAPGQDSEDFLRNSQKTALAANAAVDPGGD